MSNDANVDFNLSDVDPAQYPAFHEAASRAGWDHLTAENRAVVVDQFVNSQIGETLTRQAHAHGYDPEEVLKHYGHYRPGPPREKDTTFGPLDWVMKKLLF